MDELKIVHRQNQEPFLIPMGLQDRVVVWGTCVRQLALTLVDEKGLVQKDGDTSFSGPEAYLFCLEVISGLHSPILGETEVLGQFKKFFENFSFPPGLWGNELKKTVRSLLEDSKIIREKYLKNGGSQTYGSAVRRRLRDFQNVAVLGSGDLARSILPWLEDKKVSVICREVHARAVALKSSYPAIELLKWNEKPKAFGWEAVVCAAPLKNDELENWFLTQEKEFRTRLFIDLRENSSRDGFKHLKSGVICLQEFFDEIQKTQSDFTVRRDLAKVMALELTQNRKNKAVIRPFGWEDLCAY